MKKYSLQHAKKLIKSAQSRLNTVKEVGERDFPLIREFLQELSLFYYYNYTFRAVFDTWYKGGACNEPVPPPQANRTFNDGIGDTKKYYFGMSF